MTISSEVRKNGPYTGNGVTTAFPFTFKVFATSEVLVVLTDLTPADHTLVLDTDYTVALNADQDASPGGTVTMLIAPPTGYLLTLGGKLTETQSVVLTNNGGFYPEVVSRALDYLTILVQQLNERLSRSLSLPFSTGGNVSAELPPVSPGSLIGWKQDGTGLTNAGGTGVAPGGIVASNMAAGATATALVADIAASAAKTIPIDADTVGYVDSTTGNLVRATWTNIKAFLKTYFDTLYLTVTSADVRYLLAKPGQIIEFAGTAAPAGYLACPIALTYASATAYKDLAFAIGVTWGNGGATVNAGAFTPGNTYIIKTPGTTDFTLIGAANNVAGTVFTATGVGAGTGVANSEIALPWFPADYTGVQANGNVGTQTTGEVKLHDHFVGSPYAGAAGTWAIGSGSSNTATSSGTGGAANLAAGSRVLKCVKY